MIPAHIAKEYLHLREWLDWAATIVARGESAYRGDRILQEAGDALMMKIGEAANRLDRWGIAAPAGITWSAVVSNRNLLIHRYDDVDRAITWATLTTSLPGLAVALQDRIDEAEAQLVSGEQVEAADVLKKAPFGAQ